MTFTRDSVVWWLILIAAAGTGALQHWDKIVVAFSLGTSAMAWHERIDLLIMAAAGLALYLRMSPLALSHDHPLATKEASTVLSPINSNKTLGGLLLAVTLAASSFTACASLPAKQNAVVSLQSSELALEAAHDAERALCSPAADKTQPIRHCDGATAVSIGLTDARHHQIAAGFVKAFDTQLKAAVALKAWHAGDPVPTTVAEYQKDATDILAIVGQVLPKSQATVVKVQQAIDEAAKIAAILGGK